MDTARQMQSKYDLEGGEIGRVQDIADDGTMNNALKGAASVIEFVARPFKTAQLGIRDVLSVDTKRSQGTREIEIGDYIDVMMGRSHELAAEDRLGPEIVGKYGDLSTANLMDDIWTLDEDTPMWARIARGLVSFSGDVATDPASYVTVGSGGVGKTAVLAAAEAAVAKATRNSVTRILRQTVDDVAEEAFERTLRESIQEAADPIYRSALDDAARALDDEGMVLTDEIRDQLYEDAVQEAAFGSAERAAVAESAGVGGARTRISGGEANRRMQELAQPLERRDWDLLPKDYVDYVFSRGSDGARRGKAFTTGGIRLGVPFSPSLTTRPIPGTPGLLKRIPGVRPVREWSKTTRVRQWLEKNMPFVNAENPLHQAARRSVNDPLPTYAEVKWARDVAMAARQQIGNGLNNQVVIRAAGGLDDAVKDLTAEQRQEIWGLAVTGMQRGGTAPPDILRYGEDVTTAFEVFTSSANDTIGKAYAYLRKIDPNGVGFLESHVPLMFTNDFVRAVRSIEQNGLPGVDLSDPAAVARVEAKLGLEEGDLPLLLEVVDNLGGAKAGKASIGNAPIVRQRTTGLTMARLDPNGQSPLMFWDDPLREAEVGVPPQGARVQARVSGDAVQSVDQLEPDDLSDILMNTTDQRVADRVTEYYQGKPVVGDEVDDLLVDFANQRRGAVGTVQELDEETREEVLKRAKALLADMDPDEYGSKTVHLKDGVEAELRYGYTDGGERFTIATANGELVSARIGAMSGTEIVHQGRGAYKAILRHQKDEMGLTIEEVMEGTGPIAQHAANAINEVFYGKGPVRPMIASQKDLGERLANTLTTLNKQYSLNLKYDGTQALIDDPVEIVGNYLAEMQTIAEQRAFAKAVSVIGGSAQMRQAANLEQMLHSVGLLTPEMTARARKIIDDNSESLPEILARPQKMRKVSIGDGQYLEIPSTMVDDPRMRKFVAKVKRQQAAVKRQRRTVAKMRQREYKRLTQDLKMDHDTATALTNATIGDMPDLRREFGALTDQLLDEMEAVHMLAWARGEADHVEYGHAIESVIQHREALNVQLRGEMKRITTEYDELFPMVDETGHIVADGFAYDDPVLFGNQIAALMKPVGEELQARRLRNLQTIQTRLVALADEEFALQEQLLDFAPKKNTVDPAVGNIYRDEAAVEARLAAIREETEVWQGLYNVIGEANTADDIAATFDALKTSSQMQRQAADQLHKSWTDLVDDGLEALRFQVDQTGEGARVLAHVTKAWEKYTEAVELGTATLQHQVFDDPWFWRVIGMGHLSKRELGAEQADLLRSVFIRDGLDAAGIDEGLEAASLLQEPMIFHSIRGEIQGQIDGIQALAERASTDVKALQELGLLWERFGGSYEKLVFEMSDEQRMAAAAKVIVAKQNTLDLLNAGDEAMWINKIASRMQGTKAQLERNTANKVKLATANEEWEGMFVSVDKALRALAEAPFDDRRALDAIRLQADLNKAIEMVYPNRELQMFVTPDGFRMRLVDTTVVPASKRAQDAPEVSELFAHLDQGLVTVEQLRDAQLGFIADGWELRNRAKAQRRAVTQLRNKRGPKALARAQHNVEELNTLTTLVADLRQGKVQARRLREWVFDGTSTGRVVQSSRYRTLLKGLPEEDGAKLQRMVEAALASADDVSGVSESLLMRNGEDYWTEVLFEPIKKTVSEMQALKAEITQDAAEVVAAEQAQARKMAQAFIDEITILNEFARPADLDGFPAAGVRLAENVKAADGRSADQVLKDAMDLWTEMGGPKGPKKKLLASLETNTINMRPDGMVPAENFGLGGVLGDLYVDPMVGAMFRNMITTHKAMFTPQGLSEFQKAGKELLRWWRASATVARLPFHMRNVQSAVANNMLIGVGARHYAILGDFTRFKRVAATDGIDAALDAVNPANRAAFRAAIDNEVINTNFVRQHIGMKPRGAKGVLSRINPANTDSFALFSAGAWTMQTMEDAVRFVAFARHFDAAVPESASLARQMVMVAHFDYQNLAVLEQKFKAIAPFFIWTRRNVPLMLRAIYEQPAYVAVWGHMQRAIQNNMAVEMQGGQLAPWSGSLAVPLGIFENEDSEYWSQLVFDPDLPIGNLDELPLFAGRQKGSASPFGEQALSPTAYLSWAGQLLAPQFSMGAQLMYQEDDYRTNAPTGLNEILRALDMLPFWDSNVSAAGDAEVSGSQAALFRTAIPFLAEYTAPFDNSSSRQARFGLTPDPSMKDRVDALMQAQVGAGLGLTRQTPTDVKSASWDARSFLEDLERRKRKEIGGG